MPKKKSKTRNIVTVITIIVFLLGTFFLFREFSSRLKTTSNIPFSKAVERELLEKAGKHIFDYDYIICYDTMSIVWVNSETVKLTGYTQEEAVKLKNFDLLEGYSRGTILLRVLKNMIGKEGSFEVVIKTKDGQYLELTIAYHTFSYKKSMHAVGKIKSYKTISADQVGEYFSKGF